MAGFTHPRNHSSLSESASSATSMSGSAAAVMAFDEAWPILQEEAINKIIVCLQGQLTRQIFTSQEYMRLYTVVYDVASPNPLGPEVDKLYAQYKRTFEDVMSAEVLPPLLGKEGNNLLKELLRGWNKHKTMVYWLSRIFNYLSRYYIPIKRLPSFVETSNSIFYSKVYVEIKDRVIDAVTSLIERESEGGKTDLALAKQVLSIFEEIGGDALENYEKDIGEAMVEASGKFYSRKALDWMATMSYDEYMLKVEQCLETEKSRVSVYSKPVNKNRLLEVVQHELLDVHAKKLEEKRASSS